MVNVTNNDGVTSGGQPPAETPHLKLSDVSKMALKVLAVAFVVTVVLAALEIIPIAVPIVTGIALAILAFPRKRIDQLPAPIRKVHDYVAGTIKDILIAPVCGALMVSDLTVKDLDRKTGKNNGKIDKIVTLGSPFHGTLPGPVISFFPCVAQMRYKDSYNEGLRAWMRNSDVEFHHYGTESDIIIIPQSSAHTEGKNNHPLEKGVGHLSMLFSDKIIDKVAKNLDRDKPVLFVHGIFGHSTNWSYVNYRLKKMGFTKLYGINLGHPFQKIDEGYAPKVVEEIDAITAKTGQSVQIIAHSMGGLVSTQAAKDLSERHTV